MIEIGRDGASWYFSLNGSDWSGPYFNRVSTEWAAREALKVEARGYFSLRVEA